MRLLIHFARFGPYHHARLRAAHEVLAPLGWEVIGLEMAGTDATYAWDETKGGSDAPRVITAFPGRVHEEIDAAEYREVLLPLLNSIDPDAMAIAGWGSKDAQACLSWCRKHDVRRIVMSETRSADGKRVWWKEFLKRYFISRFHGALVGGRLHQDYLVSLGMKLERIALGYNVVDNGYFVEKTEDYKTEDRRGEAGGQRSEVGGRRSENGGQASGDGGRGTGDGSQVAGDRSQASGDQGPRTVPQAPDSGDPAFVALAKQAAARLTPYFLASNRFIERKNLARLIDAYAAYVREAQSREVTDGHRPPLQVWDLVLLGDGELKPALLAQCHRLGLHAIESAPWEGPGHTPEQGTSNIEHRTSNFDQAQSTKHEEPSTAAQSLPSTKHKAQSTVFFPGFRQIEELPRFYAHAGCFVHPALEEPWGLVLNEAMASGLPVLSGDNVGAAEELLDDGVNGWKFDAGSVEDMAGAMGRMASLTPSAHASMSEASRRILEERCPTKAFGEGLARLLVSV